MDKLTQDQKDYLEDAFNSFADQEENKVNDEQAEKIIRSLDCCPSDMNFETFTECMKKDEDGLITYEDFAIVVGKRLYEYDKNKNTITTVFQKLDTRKRDCINFEDFKLLLAHLGARGFNEKELKLFEQEAEIKEDGLLYYHPFAVKLSRNTLHIHLDDYN